MKEIDLAFWKEKKVFLTGHTGFKGSWLSLWLTSMGAKVTGYALNPVSQPNLYDVLDISRIIDHSLIGDIRDLALLQKSMHEAEPDIVIHMAAQPLVRYSYVNPVETYSTNVMGTVHVLESARYSQTIRATVIVTTDKCYENKEWVWGYRENEPMGGNDPYSSSKGCAELVTAAYRNSFFSDSNYAEHRNAIGTVRSGNVIGGGDWSEDRLIPDAIKAFINGKPLMIRNPLATRPWQHVLEPLSGYLVLAQSLYLEGVRYAGGWNFGPRDEDTRAVKEVIELLSKGWGKNVTWQADSAESPHEAQLLKLDCSKARVHLGWRPKWSVNESIAKILEWQCAYQSNLDMKAFSLSQIQSYIEAQYS
jgi:CDP-glucose 4,6-dehydratase